MFLAMLIYLKRRINRFSNVQSLTKIAFLEKIKSYNLVLRKFVRLSKSMSMFWEDKGDLHILKSVQFGNALIIV